VLITCEALFPCIHTRIIVYHWQVTSTSDMAPPCFDGEEQLGLTLNSIDSTCFMDNLSSISIENMPPSSLVVPPVAPPPVVNETRSVAMGAPTIYDERGVLPTSYLNSYNMVVNDMSSVLTQLVEENKYLGIQG